MSTEHWKDYYTKTSNSLLRTIANTSNVCNSEDQVLFLKLYTPTLEHYFRILIYSRPLNYIKIDKEVSIKELVQDFIADKILTGYLPKKFIEIEDLKSSKFRFFLKTSVENYFIDWLRKQKKHSGQEVLFNDDPEQEDLLLNIPDNDILSQPQAELEIINNRLWIITRLTQALIKAQKICENENMATHFKLFTEYYLISSEFTPSWRTLAERHALKDEKQARNWCETALKKIRRALFDIVDKNHQSNVFFDEFREIRTLLNSDCDAAKIFNTDALLRITENDKLKLNISIKVNENLSVLMSFIDEHIENEIFYFVCNDGEIESFYKSEYNSYGFLKDFSDHVLPLENVIHLKNLAKHKILEAKSPHDLAHARFLYHISIAIALCNYEINISSKSLLDNKDLYKKISQMNSDNEIGALFKSFTMKITSVQ